jgi:hypothetical protein
MRGRRASTKPLWWAAISVRGDPTIRHYGTLKADPGVSQTGSDDQRFPDGTAARSAQAAQGRRG